jgi:hypothetical protein
MSVPIDVIAASLAGTSAAENAGVAKPGTAEKLKEELVTSKNSTPPLASDVVTVGEQKYLEATTPKTYTKFPIDIQDKDSGRPYVMFYIYDTVTAPISGAVTGDTATQSLKTGFNAAINRGKVLADQTAGIVDAVTSVGTNLLDNIGEAVNVNTANGASSLLKERFAGFSLKRNIQQSSDTIVLFMPDSLQASYEHNYDEISVTATLGAAGMLAQALADNDGGASGATDPYILEAASKVVGALPGIQSSEELTNLLVFGTTGRAINPQMEVLYNSPRLRTFSFDFRLVPRSQKEAEAIKTIVNKFKFYAAPTIEAGTSGRYYIPPSRFVMEFYHRGTENPYLFKTKQCVLESVALDYAPNGYATHYDGAPIETRMQLIFKETTMISRSDLNSTLFGAGATY